MRSSVLGVLLGVATGEALALPVAISGDPGSWGGLRLDGVLAYGSVTESVVALARSLVDGCGFNPGLFARVLAETADFENPVRFYSAATAEFLAAVRKGAGWEEARTAAGLHEPPAEAVARAAPVALFYTSHRLAADMSAAQALATYMDPVLASAARIYGAMLHHVLQGLPLAEAAEEAALEEPVGAPRVAALEALEAALSGGEPRAARGPVGVLAASVYAAVRAERGLEPLEALRLAAVAAPEPRAAAAAAGGLLAAAGLLEPLGEELEAYPMVSAAADMILEARSRCVFTD